MKILSAVLIAAALSVASPISASAETVDEICYLSCPKGGKLTSTLQCACFKKPPQTQFCSLFCWNGYDPKKPCQCNPSK